MDVLERVEKGEVFIAVGGIEESQNIPFFKELLRLAKLGKQMQWGSVEERLPQKDQLVLVAKGSWLNLKTFFIDGDGYPLWYDYVLGEGCEINEYTHWMPLPPNPGEGD